jgi:nucleoside 2-deoxyribosyltransferase
MTQRSETDAVRVYCAGPLFNQSERDEMRAIANVLAKAGFGVYLPHRDGMEFRLIHRILVKRGWEPTQAAHCLHTAIFALDVYQLAVECDAVVWNLNGRVPDEGAVSEAAMAWTLGKPLIAYSDDVRSLIAGRKNPLLVGMVDFSTVDEIAAIPEVLSREILKQPTLPKSRESLSFKMETAVSDGEKLWYALTQRHEHCDDETIADAVTELFAPSEPIPVQ